MSGVRGNVNNLRKFNQRLAALPTHIARDVTARVASVITAMAKSDYASGNTCYGAGRPGGVTGKALDLIDSGFTFDHMQFVSDGTSKIRASINARYVKYLIGKYGILPSGNAVLPLKWQRAIDDALAQRVAAELEIKGSV